MTHEIDIFRGILSEFGKSIGMSALQPDEDGYCCLAFDDKVQIHMQVNKRTQNLIFFCEIGTINDCDKDQAYAEILAANHKFSHTEGHTLGFNTKNSMVTQSYQEPMKNFDFNIFQARLKTFLEQAEVWGNKLIDIKNTSSMPNGVYEAPEYEFDMISV